MKVRKNQKEKVMKLKRYKIFFFFENYWIYDVTGHDPTLTTAEYCGDNCREYKTNYYNHW